MGNESKCYTGIRRAINETQLLIGASYGVFIPSFPQFCFRYFHDVVKVDVAIL